MNTLAAHYTLYLFEEVPKAQREPGKARWWSNIPQSKPVPFAFAWSILLTTDTALLVIAGLIGFTIHTPIITLVSLELFYLGACVLLLLARTLKQFFSVVGVYLVVFGLGIILNLIFPGSWGSICFYVLGLTVFYRFPPRWALPFAVVCILTCIITQGYWPLHPFPRQHTGWTITYTLVLICGLCWGGWTRRTRYLLVVKLHEAQEQLRAQMVRGEELAAARERTRIARDIHDVLSHSLAVLSIQVQAARHLRIRDPERLAEKLDDMAALIRESIAESRRVVGLLREPSPPPANRDDQGARLRFIATTFNERTGIKCRFEESGPPHTVSPQQQEALELALREMLTNAHRHGAAQTVWITLQ